MAVRRPLPAPPLRPEPLRIVVVAAPTTEALDVVGALDVLTHANNTLRSRGRREPGYLVEIVATRPGLITRWSGFDMVARRAYQDVGGRIDTLILGAADDPNTLTEDVQLVVNVGMEQVGYFLTIQFLNLRVNGFPHVSLCVVYTTETSNTETKK